MTAAAAIIADLNRAGVTLEVYGVNLRFQSIRPLTDEQRRVIAEHKADILAALAADPPAPATAPLPQSAPPYLRLLALAPSAGLEEDAASYIVGVRAVVLGEYQDCDDDVLTTCLRGWATERPARCATCGPVWLPPHWPGRVTGCPWCSRTRAGLAIPRPSVEVPP